MSLFVPGENSVSGIKAVAFDLDGTITQHKTPLEDSNRKVLDRLGEKYRLVMVGAGKCGRIFSQMGNYPIEIIGNYGMQWAEYDSAAGAMIVRENNVIPCGRDSVERRVTMLREKYGYTDFTGDNVEYHDSGCVTIPLLGTKAQLKDKLAFDPDRSRRRKIYSDVCALFPDFTVFVGGTSSFDMAPYPYDKAYALKRYCEKYGYTSDEIVYVGDDYGTGGNDEAVYKSGFPMITTDDYRQFGSVMSVLL